MTATIKIKVNVRFMSNINEYFSVISCLVIPKITQALLAISFDISRWDIPKNLRFADQLFYQRNAIDLMLGSDVFCMILLMKQICKPGLPVLQKTRLGWIASGKVDCQFQGYGKDRIISCFSLDTSDHSFMQEVDIDKSLVKFWEMEQCHDKSMIFSKNEQLCEEKFIDTYRRDLDGRFIVKFPFKENLGELGTSRGIALKRLILLNKRLAKNEALKIEYVKFLKEYRNLGRLTKINDFNIDISDSKPCFYLQRHAIVKESTLTKKVPSSKGS